MSKIKSPNEKQDEALRKRVADIVQTAGGTAKARELFGTSLEALKQFLGGPAVGKSHAGTIALIRANADGAEKRAREIAAEREKAEREDAKDNKAHARKRAAKRTSAKKEVTT